jgi:hypothetical protein
LASRSRSPRSHSGHRAVALHAGELPGGLAERHVERITPALAEQLRDALDQADLEDAQRDVGRTGFMPARRADLLAQPCARRSPSAPRPACSLRLVGPLHLHAAELPAGERLERLLRRIVDRAQVIERDPQRARLLRERMVGRGRFAAFFGWKPLAFIASTIARSSAIVQSAELARPVTSISIAR